MVVGDADRARAVQELEFEAMTESFRIAVASGKGGTGKTTISTNLTAALARAGHAVTYVDCDVEEPNGHLFLAPVWDNRQEVSIPVPEVDAMLCTHCGACQRACRHSAIVVLASELLTFPKLCHGCGGCILACPQRALREVPRPIGWLETGRVMFGDSRAAGFLRGQLEVGEATAPPVIRAVLEAMPKEGILVIDAPPGTSCPVIASVKDADVVLLVTEPTPFGLNDLKLAVEMVRELGVPVAVAINRAGTGDRAVYDYLANEKIPILLELTNDRRIAKAYSEGKLALEVEPTLGSQLLELVTELRELSHQERPKACVSPPVRAAETLSRSEIPQSLVRLGRRREIPELVVLSGKGGTGKTSIVASLAALGRRVALADCDVDAADLHLVLEPTIKKQTPFSGGAIAQIRADDCQNCGQCHRYCRFSAVIPALVATQATYTIDATACEGCGVCVDNCPSAAIDFFPVINGQWFVSETRLGPMVHARLGVAQENSGKMVSLVRREARIEAERQDRELLICDGSPGIGCPVLASLTGARQVLLVTEPTVSGYHDLERVVELAKQLGVPAGICINKSDLNPEMTAHIELQAARWNLPVFGTVRYDDAVTTAQIERRAVVELEAGPAAMDIASLWTRLRAAL